MRAFVQGYMDELRVWHAVLEMDDIWYKDGLERRVIPHAQSF